MSVLRSQTPSTRLTGLQPNIDVALAVLASQLKLPRDASFALFATARSVGLLAHSMEQLKVGKVIRPRGRYTGPVLEDVDSVPPKDDGNGLPDAATVDRNRVFKTIIR